MIEELRKENELFRTFIALLNYVKVGEIEWMIMYLK